MINRYWWNMDLLSCIYFYTQNKRSSKRTKIYNYMAENTILFNPLGWDINRYRSFATK